jgi:hypothetical protein
MLPISYKNLLQGAVLLSVGGLQSISTPAAAGPNALATAAWSRNPFADVTVSGRVTQANGEGLPGVTVLVGHLQRHLHRARWQL